MNTPALILAVRLWRSDLFKTLGGLFIVVLLASQSAQAATYIWTQAGGITSQSWSLDSNWSPNTTTGGVDGAGDIAIINTNITGTQTISLFNTGDAGDSIKTVGRLDFGDTNSTSPFVIQAGTGGGVLNFDNSGAGAQLNRLSTGSASDSITANVTLSDNLTISNASSAATTLITGGITSATAGTKTITNAGTGTGTVTLTTGVIGNGSGTVAVTQNSATSVLTLGGVNTYTGGTTVSLGTLQLTQTSGAAATGTFNLGGGAFQINQGGNNFGYGATLNLTAGSTFGDAGGGAINHTGAVTGNSHALTVNNDGNRLYMNGTISGISQFNVTKGALGFDLGGGNSGGGAAVNVGHNASLWVVNSTVTSTNNITLNGGAGYDGRGALFQENSANTSTLSGTITLNNGASSIGVGNTGGTIILSGKVTGTGGITKIGAGTLSLSGSTNDYTGTTAINQGTLAITGNSSGFTGEFAVNALNGTTAGTLTLNAQAGGSLASNATVKLNGGIFNYQATNAGSTLDASGYVFSGGDRNYQSTRGTGGNVVLNLANATRTAGTTNNYTTSGGTNGTENKITFTSAPSTGVLVDKGNYFGGTSYLAYDAGGFARAYSYSTDANGATSTGGTTLGSVTGMNVDLTTAAVTAQTTDSINTLRLGTTNGVAITAANTLSVDGILKAGANSATISGGSIQAVSSGGELVIRSNASGDTLIISSAIADNGTSSLTKSGLGMLTLSSANGYAGGTNLNAGILNIGNNTALGTGAVNMNGGTLRGAAGSNMTVSNNIVVGGGDNRITVGSGVNTTLTGALSGAGNLTIGGNGTNNASIFVNLSGNTMTSGTITLVGGTTGVARVQSTASSSAALDWVISGNTPSIETAGTYNFGSFGGSGNLAYQGAGNAIFSVGGLNNDATYSGVMSRTNGNASLSLLKIGTGSWTLSGANTFSQAGTGAAATTTVRDGSLIAGTNALSGVAGAFGNSTTAIVLGDATTISSGTAMNPKLLIGGVFNVGRDITVGSNNNSLGNAGTTFTIGGSTANASTFSGVTTLNQNLSVTQVTDGTLNLMGNITSGSSDTQTLTFNNAGIVNASGVIGGGTGAIAVTQSGAGTTTLSGINTYTGATTLNAGTFTLNGTLGSGGGTAITNNATFIQGSTGVIAGISSLTNAAGTTTLAGTNDYSGLTSVTGGTLTLSGAGSINSSSGIIINGSDAKFVQTSSVAGTPAITLTQGTLDGTGTVGAVTVGNGTGGIVSNGNGTTGTLTLGSVILNGAATLIFRKVDDTSTAALAITGALATTPANGQVTLNVLTAPIWANGSTYNLISYGSFSGANSDFSLGTIPGLGARQSATIGNTGPGSGFITLAIAGDTPVWTGLVSGAWTTTAIGGAQNWKLQTAGTGTEFLTNDQVIFDDTATGTTAVTINDATVAPASVVFNNSTKNYTLSGSNGITSGTLAKNGTGTVTISTANTYAGETIINGGTLIAGNGAALGSVAAGTTVASGATLDINGQNLSTEVLTISGSGVGGNGALVNNGASDQINATGRIVLAADATIGGTRRWDLRNSTPTLDMAGFTLTKTGVNLVSLVAVGVSNAGHIVVNQGRLNIESTTNLGGSSANTITVNSGATLSFWSATNAVTWSVALNDGSILQENGSSTISGPVTLTGANTVNVAGTSHFISGGISGTGGLTKTGGGVLTLSHTNSYAGGTVVSAGRLSYDAGNTAGPTGNITPFGTGSVTVNSGAQLRLGTNVGGHNNTGFNIANAVTLDGGTVHADDGIQHLTGTVNVTAASTLGSTYNGGGGDINKGLFLDGVVSGSADLTLQQSGINTAHNYNTSIVYFTNNANTYSGTITVVPMGGGNGGGSYIGINATSALASATLNLSGNNTSNAQQFGTSPIVFNTGLGSANIGALSGSGNVVLTGYNQSTHAYGADVIALDVGGNGADTSYSGVISGGGSLAKSGTGTMTVSGTSIYTGATTVSAGTLNVTGQLSGTSSTTVSGGTLLANNSSGSATGSGNVTVQSGARLGGNGLVGLVTGTQNITVNSGGILSIGNTGDIVGDDLDLKTSGVGVITFNGTLEFDIYDNFGGTDNLTNPLDTNDLLNLTSDTSIALSGTLKVTDLTGLSTTTWVEGDTWRLLDWSNVTAGPKFSGGFTTLDLPDLAAGLDWLASTDGNGFYIAVIVVPEASRTVLMLAGLMALVLRRRRSSAAGFGQSRATMATTHSGEC